jgi:O-glycosyl hydrolase
MPFRRFTGNKKGTGTKFSTPPPFGSGGALPRYATLKTVLLREGPKLCRLVFHLAAAACLVVVGQDLEARPAPVADVTVTIDAKVQYQRLDGFGEAAASTLVHPGVPKALTDKLRAVAVEKAFHDVGINMGNVGAILESPGGWERRANDNSDPASINWKGFDTSALNTAGRYLIDLAKPFGFTNYYLGGESPNVRWASPWLDAIRKQDYDLFLDEVAEQVVASLTYWKKTYGEELSYYQLGNEQIHGNHALTGPDGTFGSVDPVQQMTDLVKRTGDRLRAAGFLKTRLIVGSEETEEASYQLASGILADEKARQYVAVIGYHTYPYKMGYSSTQFILSTSGAGKPDPERVRIRNRLRDLAQRYQVSLWQTENSNAGDPFSFDSFRARAIHIHDEFLYANASAYFCMFAMWDETSHRLHFGNSNDFYKGEGNAVLINNSTGKVDITGLGYAMGHYARWIKPGAVRVEVQSSDSLVQVTAFRDDRTGRLSLVVINNSGNPVNLTVNVAGVNLGETLSGEQSTLAAYWASMEEMKADGPSSFHLMIPDTSVTSIAGKIAQ